MSKYAYIHIPFCKNKCKYCAFTSFVNLNTIDDYVEKLIFEIEKVYKKEPLKTLYFGGGTPSLLKTSEVEKIINKFNFEDSPEISFEINPENIDLNYLKGLKSTGINRLSIGFQTFNDKILNSIGRIHTSKDSINAVNYANKAGFYNISGDLMYGLINQKEEDLKNDIKILKSLDIPHISTYGLKIEEKTYFWKYPPDNLPDEEAQEKMYRIITDEFSDFEHYEISNFAKDKSFISKHNYNYWKLNPYYGFGVSASGFTGEKRYKNTEIIKKYFENPLLKEEIYDVNKMEEMIFLNFRTKEGINSDEINEKFNIDFEKKYEKILKKYIETGHIKKENRRYSLTLNGILISNYILCDFL